MASGLTHGASAQENDEFIEVETKALSDVLLMIEDGQISDAKTIVALLFVAGFRLGN